MKLTHPLDLPARAYLKENHKCQSSCRSNLTCDRTTVPINFNTNTYDPFVIGIEENPL